MIFPLLVFLTVSAAFPLLGTESRLISTCPNEVVKVSTHGWWSLKLNDIPFIDLTEQYPEVYEHLEHGETIPLDLEKPHKEYEYPQVSEFHSKEVAKLVAEIDSAKIYTVLSEFSSFRSRFYKSELNMESSAWLYDQLIGYAAKHDNYNLVTVNHPSWPQPSYILEIHGSGNQSTRATAILGAHHDSTNLHLPYLLPAPGADDDGSGVATLLETVRVLSENDITFANDIEFHFYAAEEGGLLGSGAIFSQYRALNEKKVVAMLQQDMTGHTSTSLEKGYPEHFGILTDSTSPKLTEFLKTVIDQYTSIPVFETSCGFGCSDHYSAFLNGYPSAMVAEAKREFWNPHAHTIRDTIDKLSVLHMAEHVKLSLGYAFELGQYSFDDQ
ncbi:hypothetical protein OGAPHI_005590 [Ogataea philodendri]|uniref:Peptide hydrolase n=1 Tax=Ogataea philodendri TaxID=1378263 RepID=A0A9P8NYP1_9ASCO|nr:uncharacterized protein OGAPHI_005590 [Ogataea philodendri]KAH3662338.1 hypothetical protein OGAPHI_005590 [Ogataea philodendri]